VTKGNGRRRTANGNRKPKEEFSRGGVFPRSSFPQKESEQQDSKEIQPERVEDKSKNESQLLPPFAFGFGSF